MSELLENAARRKELLKSMILKLHQGTTPEVVRKQLVKTLGQVPYNEVVEVEQELVAEGMPIEELLKLCDIHTEALRGTIQLTRAPQIPRGHPVHTFKEENKALNLELKALTAVYSELEKTQDAEQLAESLNQARQHFNALADVEKHYSRKENLLFPFLEKHGITGPSRVMWGKHDEARALLDAAIEALGTSAGIERDEAQTLVQLALRPASNALEEMIYKEEQILFPMALDTLTEDEWHRVYHQSAEIGFCLYDPTDLWGPAEESAPTAATEGKVQLPTGGFTVAELNAVLSSIPFDLTFVDKDDRVRFFTQGRERIFARSRAILGRKVQLCHPPTSVHIVERILDDFKSGREDRAPFWIDFKGRFIHIEYVALRDSSGNYLGTLEISQDLTEKRALEGEQRLLQYAARPDQPSAEDPEDRL